MGHCNNTVMLALHNLVINPDWNDYLENATLSSLRLCSQVMTQSEVRQAMSRNRDTIGALTTSISISDIFLSLWCAPLAAYWTLRRVGCTVLNMGKSYTSELGPRQLSGPISLFCLSFPPYPLLQHRCCLLKKVKHAFTLLLECFATCGPLPLHLPVNILYLHT